MCPFDYTAVAGNGKVGPVNQVNHTSWVAVVTPIFFLKINLLMTKKNTYSVFNTVKLY